MTTGNISLSICIPTFNRLHYLKESLEVLLPQTQQLGVEVCISDNHSTDGTADYLAGMAKSFSCLCFVVQEENIGIDRNMATVISMGQGCYIYPIGDDDVLSEGTVLSILKELNTGEDVVILNGWHTDAFLLPKREHLSKALQGKIILSPDIAFSLLWDKMPFGSFLASRNCFSAEYFDRFIGTSHAYTGAVWDALAEKYQKTGECRVKCMSQHTVLLRGGEKSWRDDAAIIMLYEIPKWFSLIMESNEYKEVASSIRTTFLNKQTSILNLLRNRAIGQLEYSSVDKLGLECTSRQIERMQKIAKLPKCFAKFLIFTYDVLKRIIRCLDWK